MKKFLFSLFSVIILMGYLLLNPASAWAVMSPDRFYDKYIGESVDVDNYPAYQPYQCYDLWAQFIMDVYDEDSPVIITPTGYPRDIWNNFDGLGLDAYFTKVEGNPRDGDWVIYDSPAFSHVGMFRSENDDGTIIILHQNYLGQPEVTQDRFTANYILGFIRPNVYIDGKADKNAKPTISIDKNEITVGEEITFSFTSAKSDKVVLRIYKDDERIAKKEWKKKKSYTTSFDEAGDYYAYLTAYDDGESVKSKKVYFSVLPEATPTETEGEPLTSQNTENGSALEGAAEGLPQAQPISVMVNGTPLIFDQQPIMYQSRTLVPMRAIFQALDAEVEWEVGKETVTATKDDTTIVVKIGEKYAIVNGCERPLDVPAQIINNRTLVPVRFISESLGAEVDWSIRTQTVLISMQ